MILGATHYHKTTVPIISYPLKPLNQIKPILAGMVPIQNYVWPPCPPFKMVAIIIRNVINWLKNDIGFRCQIENMVCDYRLLGAYSFFFFRLIVTCSLGSIPVDFLDQFWFSSLQNGCRRKLLSTCYGRIIVHPAYLFIFLYVSPGLTVQNFYRNSDNNK